MVLPRLFAAHGRGRQAVRFRLAQAKELEPLSSRSSWMSETADACPKLLLVGRVQG